MNQVQLVGRVGKAPELKQFDGFSVANFTVATNDFYVKNGEGQKVTDWHTVVVKNKTAESVSKHLTVGREVAITGKIKYNKWEHEGKTYYRAEVHADRVEYLGSKDTAKSDNNSSGTNDFSEDLPF